MIKNIQGQSLVEVTFAIGVIALIVTAIVGLSTIAVRNSNMSKTQTLANKYALEAMEWIRQQRDQSETWTLFKTPLGISDPGDTSTYCMQELNFSVGSNCLSLGDEISGTNLTREVEFINIDPKPTAGETIEVTVTVSWIDSKGPHNIENKTYLTDWKGDI